jgi:ATP-dependent phosphoenolpyruvate carboxykinase
MTSTMTERLRADSVGLDPGRSHQNLVPAALIEQAVLRGEACLTANGALAARGAPPTTGSSCGTRRLTQRWSGAPSISR